eukprot:CAMPEP_0172490668 /NCGR_PEP_ID=MMETSP1066-20121228/21183_1 /TAXON_ID=671091 /ORGANISM="Coscinodiscus wailesii, Strain CCMP2513" /LENGTH=397 /DNA_ID=CAMNT_0013259261 /DNA_START=172 /DNA_END=1365 /DNA_ORIENTATION=+
MNDAFSTELIEVKPVEYIPLEPFSALYDDLEFIAHSPSRRRITVGIKSQANYCPQPILWGRLSGEALALVQWEAQEDNVISGYYEVPFTGRFYLEIIVLFCQYSPTNYQNNCLIPGENHRLTSENAAIVVTMSSYLKGYWKSSQQVSSPLYTRYQPANCRRSDRFEDSISYNERCAPVDTLKFNNYTFQTYSKIMTRYQNVDISSLKADPYGYNCLKDTKGECKLCSIGSSHSNRVHRFLTIAVGLDKMGGLRREYPQEIRPAEAVTLMKRCDTILIGFGQHDLAYAKTRPRLFGRQMRRLLKKFKGHPRVFVRSVHYNPLGDEKLTCPPLDGRNPMAVVRYNDVMKDVCNSMDIPWIDTRWIDAVMWDSARDWNHLSFEVEVVQEFFIADYLGFLD